MNSDAMADYDGVGWRSVAGDPWVLRSTNGLENHGEYEAGCWLGFHGHWDQGLALYTSHCNNCQSSYLCSTNLAKAAPSPAPTTAVPTISAAPTMDVCSSVGEFECEGRTLYCVEAEGEIHNVLRVEGSHSTCRHTDENSCPDGFDIWVPRSYAQGVARGEWFMRSSTHHEPNGDYEAGCWLGTNGWTMDEGFEFYDSQCHQCFSTYLCSTNTAKATPSPAPTITPGPTVTAVPTVEMCSSSGEFEYEGHTVYCVEAAGEIHSVLPVNFGQKTCRHTDENSCPVGFDIWVPRSYAHALAVVEATGWHAPLVGIYRNEDGGGCCSNTWDQAMNSDAMATYDGVGWQSVAGDPWFMRSSTYSEPNG